MTGHEGHEIISVSGRRWSGALAGFLVCATCSAILRGLPTCGTPTLKGRPCRAVVRVDKGFTGCAAHSGPRRAS
jgi:hypothetical protein